MKDFEASLKGFEKKRIIDKVLDDGVFRGLYKLMDRRIIMSLEGKIKTGKESHIFLALTPEGKHVCVKIYMIETSGFQRMREYVAGDVRFSGVKNSKRPLVMAWCRKEYSNLSRAHDAGVRVPKPLGFMNNVLVMSFIGDEKNRVPAPSLSEVRLEDPEAFFRDLVKQAGMLYKDCELVHADLSEYNVLVHEGKPWIIDMGQSVLLSHPRAREFLERDVLNIVNYFNKKYFKEKPVSEKEVMKKITG